MLLTRSFHPLPALALGLLLSGCYSRSDMKGETSTAPDPAETTTTTSTGPAAPTGQPAPEATAAATGPLDASPIDTS